MVVAFAVALGAVAFLLRFVASHQIPSFIPYRVALGLAVLADIALRTERAAGMTLVVPADGLQVRTALATWSGLYRHGA